MAALVVDIGSGLWLVWMRRIDLELCSSGFAPLDSPHAVFPSIVDVRGDSTGAVLGQAIALAVEARCDSTGAVFGQGFFLPVVVSGAVGQTVQKTLENPQSQFRDKVFMHVVVSGADGETAEKTCGDSTGAVLGRGLHAHRSVSDADGQTVQKTRGDSTGAVLEQVVHARYCVWCRWPDSAENCGLSAAAFHRLTSTSRSWCTG